MTNSISVAIMTQASKIDFFALTVKCLMQQKGINKKLELILFTDASFHLGILEELNTLFFVRHYQYERPFNIGHVRNLIAKTATSDYIVYIDDDILISPFYLNAILQYLNDMNPAILAGLSFHVFKRPNQIDSELNALSWDKIILNYACRDDYSRRLGRYQSETILIEKLGESNWLGVIGRNMIIKRDLIKKYGFFESETMGFEDIEFAFRMAKLNEKIVLINNQNLAVLHLYHVQSNEKMKAYKKTFEKMVDQKKLPVVIENIFFPRLGSD